ncbi:Peptide-N4-(N-acetyl-beta-glucosaminyl)asparagine amidase A [Capsicum baccatum]|uniref:Peptide-N4-(N-acetyl-beta-glucosaminyl)asparagine amidase A n=1 Tax=Capsicum baccatum TaxID=33114 RepID=A0A2G2XBP2_CAPBA|nr:Peptide-N4-(N-acetyl-beta-glucosaminyl)asparagine amidase A [Capsicum baccatum]
MKIDVEFMIVKKFGVDFDYGAGLIVSISRNVDLNNGLWFKIENSTDVKSKDFKIPQNVYRALLEVYVSFHENDESWYGNSVNERRDPMSVLADGLPSMVAGRPFTSTTFPSLIPKADKTTSMNPNLPFENYARAVTNNSQQSGSISRKEIVMIEGIPHIKWIKEEVDIMNRMENLQYAVIGKFISKGNNGNKVEVIDKKREDKPKQIVKNHAPKPWLHKLQKGKAKILSSGKVVGDPGIWNVVRDRNPSKQKQTVSSTLPVMSNKFDAIGEKTGVSSNTIDKAIENNSDTSKHTKENKKGSKDNIRTIDNKELKENQGPYIEEANNTDLICVVSGIESAIVDPATNQLNKIEQPQKDENKQQIADEDKI